MSFESLGGIRIFRPSVATETAVRLEAETALRSKYASGIYNQRDQINSILQDCFRFYDAMLKELIPRVASFDLMQFVLAQYDFASEIEHKQKTQQLNKAESERWSKLGPWFRRAAKYFAECVCMLAPDRAPAADRRDILAVTERCWICVEQMVELSVLSTQTFVLFPNNTTLELRPSGEQEWFVIELDDPTQFESFGERIQRDTTNRKNYINEGEVVYTQSRIAEHFDSPFANACGFTLTDAIRFAIALNKNTLQLNEGFDIPFVSERQIIESLIADGKMNEEQACRLVDGVCLRRAKMINEGRVIWKPKQEYRAYTRPFFEFPHPSGSHLMWSRKMAEECLIFLYLSLAQKQIPPEWQLGDVVHAAEDYVSSITETFEDIVNKSLGTVGITSQRFRSRIGQGENALTIPEQIGELDSLGYWNEHHLLLTTALPMNPHGC